MLERDLFALRLIRYATAAAFAISLSSVAHGNTFTLDIGEVNDSFPSSYLETFDISGLGLTLASGPTDFNIRFANGNAFRLDDENPVSPNATVTVQLDLFHNQFDIPAAPDGPPSSFTILGTAGSANANGSEVVGIGSNNGGRNVSYRSTTSQGGGYTFNGVDITADLTPDPNNPGGSAPGDYALQSARFIISVSPSSNYNLSVVPEPTSLALLGLGGLLIARRRRG